MQTQQKGIAAAPGIAIGTIWRYIPTTPKIQTQKIAPAEIEEHLQHFLAAQAQVDQYLQRLYHSTLQTTGADDAEIFASHLELLHDEEFEKDIADLIRQQESATFAVKHYLDEAAARMAALDDEYLQARAADFIDLQKNLLQALNHQPLISLINAPKNCIIVAEDLTPSETAQLNPAHVRGFALRFGGRASHAAILARNLGIPAVMGLEHLSAAKDETTAILDGSQGLFIIDPDESTLNTFKNEIINTENTAKEYNELRDLPAVSQDGIDIHLFTNIGSTADLHLVDDYGSEGIGLFRSEFLFMSTTAEPSEEVQYHAYRQVVEHLAPKPVILRLLDIGGDKPLPYFNFPQEENPFLGWRGVRIYTEMRDLFETQIRAALRASAFGNLHIMVPMVNDISEMRFVRETVAQQAEILQSQGIACNPQLPVGAMIETPAAALITAQLSTVCDFFSIGSNGLTQYTLAIDRGNSKIATQYDGLHPAVLRLIAHAVDAAQVTGRTIGICGEMGGQIEAVPLLFAMGFDELSISGAGLPAVKQLIRRLNYRHCRELLARALNAASADAVRELVRPLLTTSKDHSS